MKKYLLKLPLFHLGIYTVLWALCMLCLMFNLQLKTIMVELLGVTRFTLFQCGFFLVGIVVLFGFAVVHAEAENRVSQQMQSKMQFFANMSHEIRTPLNSVIGFSELLEEEEDDPTKRSRLAVVTKAGRQLMNIINDVLDISKLELSGIELENRTFSLVELMLEIHRTYQPMAENQRLRLSIQLDEGYPQYLYGDVHRIRQIFSNLISNALKFTAKGSIEIHVGWREDTLTFSVKDSGIGIAADKRDHIFDAFAQADRSTTRMYGGTGLGLAICRKLAEAMGGNIQLSDQVTHGAMFTVTLHLQKAEEKPLTEGEHRVFAWLLKDIEVSDLIEAVIKGLPQRIAQMEAYRAGGELGPLKEAVHALKGVTGNFSMTELYSELVKMDQQLKEHGALTEIFQEAYTALRGLVEDIPEKYLTKEQSVASSKVVGQIAPHLEILMAEDVAENRHLIQQMLFKIGVTADEAENGAEALKKLRSRQYDLLLLDMHMPIVDGMTVLNTIREDTRYEKLRIIAMTASSQREEIEAYLAGGCWRVIPKPVDKELLRATIVQLMESQ